MATDATSRTIKPPPPPLNYPTPILPGVVDSSRPCKEYQYAAKLVTGIMPPQSDLGVVVAPGAYLTAVNVHNPSTCRTVTFRWKVAVARPVDQPFGAITRFQKVTLRPDQAVEIDSQNVARALGVGLNVFVKGYVVLESPCELDAVAVYTGGAAGPAGHPANLAVLDVERVPARRICACQDLSLDLSTGATPWTLVSAVDLSNSPLPGIVTPRPATIIQPADQNPNWASLLPANWISVRDTAASLPNGFYVYQRCFTLCSDFENARIDLHFVADDNAKVWLNNNQVPGPTGTWTTPTALSITYPSWFLPGLNCLSFVVPNTGGPSGLDVLGKVTADRGACGDGCGCCCGEGGDVVYPPPHIIPEPVPARPDSPKSE